MKFRLQRCRIVCRGVRSNSLIGPGDIVAFRANAQLKHFENVKLNEKTFVGFLRVCVKFQIVLSKIYPL